jgi:branched-chain amino acid transport system substrate-binding protein
MKNNIFFYACQIMVFLIFFTGCGSGDTIQIGAILPLTGYGYVSGNEMKNAILIAKDDINTAGGINGKKIEYIIEDSKSDKYEAAKAFLRIEKKYKPLFYITAQSISALAIAPYAEKNNVVLIALSSSNPEIIKNRNWVFKYYFTENEECRIAKIIIDRLEIKTIGILYINNEGAESILHELQKLLEQQNRYHITSIPFDPDILNYNDQIKQVMDMDAVYFIGNSNQIKYFLPQIRKDNYKGKLISMNSGAMPEIIEMKESDGLYVSSSSFLHPNIFFADKIKEKYQMLYNTKLTFNGASSYDAIRMISILMDEKDISRKNVRKVLDDGFVYPGILGVLNVSKGNHEISCPLFPAKIVNGKLKFIE